MIERETFCSFVLQLSSIFFFSWMTWFHRWFIADCLSPVLFFQSVQQQKKLNEERERERKILLTRVNRNQGYYRFTWIFFKDIIIDDVWLTDWLIELINDWKFNQFFSSISIVYFWKRKKKMNKIQILTTSIQWW